jgi:Leucine-rich repeat (LRR) protein/sugar lactone lactonase YvrE
MLSKQQRLNRVPYFSLWREMRGGRSLSLSKRPLSKPGGIFFLITLLTLAGPAVADVQLVAVPSTQSACLGQNFDITIQKQSTDTVDGIDLFLSFDAATLKVNSITNQSTLDFAMKNTINTGNLNYSAISFANTPPSGNFDFITLNVTPLAASAGTALQFDTNNSTVTHSGSYLNYTADDLTVAIDQTCPCSNVTEIPTAQCETLVSLYDSTNGDNWTNNDGWKTTDTPCSWKGISCYNDEVTGINLNANKLTGTIPDLSALTSVRQISLYGNQLSGYLPDFSNLINLSALNFSGNQLSGSIPDLSTLINLQSFHIQDNQFSDRIPNLSTLTKLRNLSLATNELSGPFPDLSALANLEYLALSNNQLSGTIPDFDALTNLRNLYLSGNTELCKDPNTDYGQWTSTVSSFDECQASFCDTVTEIPTAQCEDLVALYDSTDGDNWKTNTGWKQTNTPCSWHGIACSGGNVTQISLISNQLSGTISDLSQLTQLQSVILQSNQLTGTIPDLSAASNLQQLELQHNQLTGTIPSWISNMTQLQNIQFNKNQLTGAIPNLSALTQLQVLNLNKNQLTGSVPDLSALTQLSHFSANTNQLTGEIPSLNTLSNLGHLALNDNQLTGNIPDLSGLTSIQQLRLNNNQLEGPIPALTALTNLDELNLSDNQLCQDSNTNYAGRSEVDAFATCSICDTAVQMQKNQCETLVSLYDSTNGDNWTRKTGWKQTNTPCSWEGIICNGDGYVTNISLYSNQLAGTLPDLSALTELLYVSLSGNQLTGSLPDLSASTKLHTLAVNHNQLSGTLPDLSALTQLKTLYLYDNQFTGSIPDLSTLTKLEDIRLYTNQLTGAMPNLSALTQLQFLSFGNNKLTGTIPDLSALTQLQNLRLYSNQFTGSIPDLSALTQLQFLSLGDNQLTGTMPDLSALTQLQELRLYDNQLTGSIPEYLSRLTQLEILRLEDNQFSGPIPDLSALTQLTDLRLSKNQLTGPIPDVSGATNLEYLYLQENDLSGEIPTWLNTLTNLERLYLNDNGFTGEIPELGNLTNLKNLTLSNNALTGPIPASLGTLNLETINISSIPACKDPDADYGNLDVSAFLDCNDANYGLVLHLPFDGNANDNSGNGHDGTEYGQIDYVTGISGQAVEFNGNDDFITVSDSDLLDTDFAFTLSVWVNPSSYAQQSMIASKWYIYNSQGNDSEGDWVLDFINGGVPRLVTAYFEKGWNTEVSTYTDIMPVNRWHYITATFERGHLKLYIDGILVKETTHQMDSTSTNEYSTDDIFIGQSRSNDSRYDYKGLMDDFRIHNRALSASEIQSYYNSSKPATCTTVTEIPMAQCETLVALYDSTNGDNWTNNTGWKLSNTPCSWYGVTCSSGEISGIELHNNQLSDTLPDFSALNNLNVLYLNNNQLTGTIPDFSALTNLQSLNLGSNQFAGTISDFSALTNLQYFSLYSNQLSGPLPEFKALTKLVHLHLHNNQFTGSISDLSGLSNLQSLQLYSNQLTDSIPDLESLVELQRFSVANNQLSGPIPALNSLTKLEALELHSNPDLCQNPNADYAGRTEVEAFEICPDVKLVAEASTAEACIGQNLTITVNKQLAQTVNEIQMALNYDANLFKINSITNAGPLTQFNANHGNGTAQITAGNFTGISDDFAIASLQLMPLAASVGTSLQFNDSQTVVKLSGAPLRHESQGITLAIKDCVSDIVIQPEDNSAIWTLVEETQAIEQTGENLDAPKSLSFDASGNAYIADTLNHRILKRDTQGNLSVVAGTGIKGKTGDEGPAIEAKLNNPQGVAIDHEGNLYIADTLNHRIRKVDSNGIISTIAGIGKGGYAGDQGLATAAKLRKPTAIVFDSNGHLYIADSGNHRIRKVSGQRTRKPNANSIITTIAGNGKGYRGDNGPATGARLNNPSGLAVDNQNNLYIADTDNHRIRKIDNRGTITTVAGNGIKGYSGDGDPATAAQINAPTGLEVDSTGNLYIADRNNHRIRKVDNEGTITTFTGTGKAGTSTDGILAGVAQITQPSDVALDQYGNLYIADKGNDTIRKIGEQDGEEGAAPPHQIADCPNTEVTGIPKNECYALIALYDSTKGPDWTDNTGWKATDTPCQWTGVTCTNGSVTEINLSNNNLEGDVPPQIGALVNLEVLNLNDNQISGALPTTIEHLNNLETLNVENNALTGSLPAELGDATNLQTVNLANNQISGEIPDLNALTQLQTLNLSENLLNGPVPDLTALTTLQTLNISGEDQQVCRDSDIDYGNMPVGNLDDCPTGNQLPTAAFTATPNKGEAPLTVNLDARMSHDPFGNITAYFWESSDGTVLTGATPSITYEHSGLYEITLKVMDNDGAPSLNIAKHLVEVYPGPDQMTLRLDKDGMGLGTISAKRDKDPATTCNTKCQTESQDYPQDSEIKLTAKAAKGSLFTGWRGDCVGTEADNKIKVTMDSAKHCTAVFELEATPPPQMHALTIDSVFTMDGTGTIEVQDRLCHEPPCMSYHEANKNIKITGTPSPHSYFIGWNRDCPFIGESTDATNLVVLKGDATCIAYFGNDSDLEAIDTAKEFEKEAEMLGSGEPVNEMYPEAYNHERYQQAFRFAEKAMMTVKDQKLLDKKSWPDHFNDIENWFDPLPESLMGMPIWVQRVQIKSGENEFEDGAVIIGDYVHVEVFLLNKNREEELVSILVYYDEEPTIEYPQMENTEQANTRRRKGSKGYACFRG